MRKSATEMVQFEAYLYGVALICAPVELCSEVSTRFVLAVRTVHADRCLGEIFLTVIKYLSTKTGSNVLDLFILFF